MTSDLFTSFQDFISKSNPLTSSSLPTARINFLLLTMLSGRAGDHQFLITTELVTKDSFARLLTAIAISAFS